MDTTEKESYFEDESGFSDTEFQELVCKYIFLFRAYINVSSLQIHVLQII